MGELFANILDRLRAFIVWLFSNDFMVGYLNLGGIVLQRRLVIFLVLLAIIIGYMVMNALAPASSTARPGIY